MAILAPRQSSRPLPIQFQSGRGATGENFGAGVGRAQRNQGQALQQFGNDFTRIGIQAAENNAKDLDNQFKQELNDMLYGEDGLYNKQGKNAVESAASVQSSIEALQRSYSDRAINGAARRLFDGVSNNRLNTETANINKYVIGQQEKYQDEVSSTRVSSATEDAVLNWQDPSRIDASLGIVQNEIISIGERKGWSPEIISEQIRQSQSEMLTSVVTGAIASGQLAEAEQLLEERLDDINGLDQTKIAKAYTAARRQAVADYDRAEARAERQLKQNWRNNEASLMVGAVRGEFTEQQILEALNRDAISTDAYQNIVRWMRTEEEEGGDVSIELEYRNRIFNGEGVVPNFDTEELDSPNTDLMTEILNHTSLSNSQKESLQTELFESIENGAVYNSEINKNYLRDIEKIVGEKSAFGEFTGANEAEKAVRAKQEYLQRVQAGEPPTLVFNDVIKAYSGNEHPTLPSNLARPTHWSGPTTGTQDQLRDRWLRAYRATAEEFQRTGDATTALREFDRLEAYERAIPNVLPPKEGAQ